MRGWPIGLVAFLLLGVAPTALADEFCQEINDMPGAMGGMRQCWSDDSSGDSKKSENFWTSNAAQTMYWLLGLFGSGGAAIFGWTRVRRRRRELRTFLNDVEKTFAQAKADPKAGLPRLESLRRGLTASHTQGRLEDAQFLEMDRRLRECITRVRILQLERTFPNLPVALFAEIGSVLSDGQLSVADLELVEKRAVQLQVPVAQRQELLTHLRSEAKLPAQAAPGKRLAVVAK